MANRREPLKGDAGRVAPLSRLPDYEVASDNPDVRGWNATTLDGSDVGRVEDLIVDVGQMSTRYLVVNLSASVSAGHDAGDAARTVLVPIERAQLDESERRVRLNATPATLAKLPAYSGAEEAGVFDESYRSWATHADTSPGEDDTQVLTRSAEELRIGKRTVQTGEVRVHKDVEHERVHEPVMRTRDEVSVERRPVTTHDSSAAEIREDEVRIPISEEEVVVDKRPVVKEEIVVKKHKVHERADVAADLRKEHVEVERIDDDANQESRRETRDRKV